MDKFAVIATHHKGGTAWMGSTFRRIGKGLDIGVYNLDSDVLPGAPGELKPPLIFLSPHAHLAKHPWLLENPEVRILHLVRDPRDLIISGMHYHRVAKEAWVLRRRADFGKMNYQDKLNSLATDRERYIFEMSYAAPRAIGDLDQWDYQQPHSFECKYEDLITDTKMTLFERAARHLGFSDAEMPPCRDAFWSFSIFGGKKKAKSKGKKVHIRSGDPRQWSGVFDREMGTMFVERFGDVLIKLGYESDNSWVDRLPAFVPASEPVTA